MDRPQTVFASVSSGRERMTNADDESEAGRAYEAFLLLGRVTGAHGIKGEVKVTSFTEVPEDIGAYGPLSGEDGQIFVIESLRPLKGGAVAARFAGISDRTAAEALKGTELYVERAKLPEPDEDEWYHADLIGLTAVSIEDEIIGKVAALQNFGAGDLLEIEPPNRSQHFFVPFTKAAVPIVDLNAGRVVVDPPEDIEDESNGPSDS